MLQDGDEKWILSNTGRRPVYELLRKEKKQWEERLKGDEATTPIKMRALAVNLFSDNINSKN